MQVDWCQNELQLGGGNAIRSLSLKLRMRDLGTAQRAKPALEGILLTAVDLSI